MDEYLMTYTYSKGQTRGYGMLAITTDLGKPLPLVSIIRQIRDREGYDIVIPLMVQPMEAGQAESFNKETPPNRLMIR